MDHRVIIRILFTLSLFVQSPQTTPFRTCRDEINDDYTQDPDLHSERRLHSGTGTDEMQCFDVCLRAQIRVLSDPNCCSYLAARMAVGWCLVVGW